LYNPETFSIKRRLFQVNYAVGHFNSVQNSTVIPSDSSNSRPTISTPTETYSPSAADIIGIVALKVLAAPLVLPHWLITASQQFSSPDYAV
jgi:hypothetical protein